MIPLQLKLKNFLSYREAMLDFRGLHVACICGANGAGKSSLLEAIAWTVWGESRAGSEDDVIHLGESEVRVDFTFECHQQTYRIIRSRYRGQSSALEFQLETPQGFRTLTQRGMRATQQLILQHLRLDYETFINSAYLRQGRADEFMLKRPGERKQILADLLKLDQYDALAEQAKERSRQLKADLDALERTLKSVTHQIDQGEGLAVERENLSTMLSSLQTQQAQDVEALRQLQATQQQRQSWIQQLNLHQQQEQHLRQDCKRLQQELTATQQQQKGLEALLHDADAIARGYTQFHSLQAEEEVQTAKFHAHQAAQTQLQQLQQQLFEEISVLKEQQAKLQAQIETQQQQAKELEQTLNKSEDTTNALENLRRARVRLVELDQLQGQAAPLLQRRQQLQTQLDRAHTRLTARLEEISTHRHQLQTQQEQQLRLQQNVIAITEHIEYLERRRKYQQCVREKGTERRTFMERLQERQRDYEKQLAELDHKIGLLKQEAAEYVTEEAIAEIHELNHSSIALADSPRLSAAQYPPCPLCDRPLDETHWKLVLDRYLEQQQEVLDQLWVIREQLATSDREIQVLRREYRRLERELKPYGTVIERRGQLQEKLQGVTEGQSRLQLLVQEQTEIERSLQLNSYAPELFEDLNLLDQTLQQLNYDDKNHALARGEVDRWRWAEIKQAELKQARKRHAQILEKLPDLEAQLEGVVQQIRAIAQSSLQQQIHQLEQQIGAIAYNLPQHTALRTALKQAQTWQLRHQELAQAQRQYPQLQKRSRELTELLNQRTEALHTLTCQIEALVHNLEQTPDLAPAIRTLEQEIQERRLQLDAQLAQIGRLQQQQQQQETLQSQYHDLNVQQQAMQRQLRVFQELAQAYGKNGIQAMMIENVLPQLEAETNQILGRLSNHQLHVQFVTQRSTKRKSGASNLKMIDTLDILIADARGTRPYETYSGGEAFRINFAIRLALARLLAQRSGTALQLLIVDEGFGTQDEAGCDRLVSSIQAIASDFACILTVTHIPRLKEAFPTRIEVTKTDQGSQVSLLI